MYTLLEKSGMKKFAGSKREKEKERREWIEEYESQSNFGQITIIFTFPFRIILCGLAKVVLLLLGEKKKGFLRSNLT